MSADLDELFTDLGRQADALPLASAAQARRRGRQRSRTQLAVVAAAVLTVAVGVTGFLARPDRHADQAVAPTPSARALPQVGSAMDFHGTALTAQAAVVGSRVVAVWEANHSINVSALDLRTGAHEWTALISTTAPLGTTMSVQAAGSAVTVTVAEADDTTQTVYVYRADDGDLLWKRIIAPRDEVLWTDRFLVHRAAATGRTDAFDWATGDERWSVPPPAEGPVVRTVTADRDRLVQVDEDGRVRVLRLVDGALLDTATIPRANAPGENSTIIAYDEWLVHDSVPCCDTAVYRVSATNLDTGESKVLASAGVEHRFGGLDRCGPDRICVLDLQDGNRSEITAIDVAGGKDLWRVPGPDGATGISAQGENTLVGGPSGPGALYDGAGRITKQFPRGVDVLWWRQGRLLVLPPVSAGGNVQAVRMSDGRTDTRGSIPARIGPCAHTDERLVCPTGTALRIWSLTG